LIACGSDIFKAERQQVPDVGRLGGVRRLGLGAIFSLKAYASQHYCCRTGTHCSNTNTITNTRPKSGGWAWGQFVALKLMRANTAAAVPEPIAPIPLPIPARRLRGISPEATHFRSRRTGFHGLQARPNEKIYQKPEGNKSPNVRRLGLEAIYYLPIISSTLLIPAWLCADTRTYIHKYINS